MASTSPLIAESRRRWPVLFCRYRCSGWCKARLVSAAGCCRLAWPPLHHCHSNGSVLAGVVNQPIRNCDLRLAAWNIFSTAAGDRRGMSRIARHDDLCRTGHRLHRGFAAKYFSLTRRCGARFMSIAREIFTRDAEHHLTRSELRGRRRRWQSVAAVRRDRSRRKNR